MTATTRPRGVARAGTVIAVVLVAVAAAAPAGEAATARSRLYLMADDDHNQYWSVSADDPELGVTAARWVCPNRAQQPSRRCASSTNWGWYTTFSPGSVLDEKVTWTPEDPVRFHLELDVGVPADAEPYSVHVGLQEGLTVTASAAATEVAPGVWEGELTERGSWSSARGSHVYVMIGGVRRIDTSIELGLGGRSWIDLPNPVPGRSVPDLLAASPTAPEPLRFSTPARTVWFNDANWEVVSFEGDLRSTQTYEIALERTAAIALGWVEVNDAPFVHHLVRERDADAARMTDTPLLRLLRNDAEVAVGAVQRNQHGRGSGSVAATSVQPGTLALEVSELGPTPSQGSAYTAHVLLVYGERTLSRMRWRYEPAITEPFIPARAAGGGTCINRSEPVPTTRAVTTFSLDLDWDSVGLPTARWTPAHDYPNGMSISCGERGNGDGIRMTVPMERVWLFSATPASDATFVAYRDAVFEMDVAYAYAP